MAGEIYRGYEITWFETGEQCVAKFSTDPRDRTNMVTATVGEGMTVLKARARLLIDYEIERLRDPN